MLVVNRQLEPTRPIWHPIGGDPVGMLDVFGIRKLESLGYHKAFA